MCSGLISGGRINSGDPPSDKEIREKRNEFFAKILASNTGKPFIATQGQFDVLKRSTHLGRSLSVPDGHR